MQTIFHQEGGESFFLQPGLPESFQGAVIPGATALSMYGPAGLIVLQNLVRADFSIQLGIFKFLKLVRTILEPPAFNRGSLLALKNNYRISIVDSEELQIKEGEFSFLEYGNENIRAEFKASREYHVIDISWSQKMLSQSLPFFPGLLEQFQIIRRETGTSILTPPRHAGDKVLDLVQDLLSSPFDPGVQEMYVDYRIRECLLLLLLESSKTEELKLILTRDEKARLLDLRDRLENDVKNKFPIADIARDLGMNEMKLKLAFKQEFGKGIFKFHLEQRMKEAHRLLKESGLPAKMIAGMVGYELTTSFITQFRLYFGYPPGRIQKKL